MPSVERPISARFESMLRDVLRRLAALERPVRRVVPAGDTLPTSPDEGEQFDLRFAHDGLYRRCTWRGALNGGAGAWAASGPALRGSALASQSTTSTSPTDLATPGPSVVIPCAGRYVVRIEADLYNTTGGATLSVMEVQGPGLAAGAGGPVVISGNTQRRTSASEEEVTFTGAGTVICKYNVGGGTGVYQRRRIAVWPVELRP